jgi:hypothetical protein
MRLNTWKNLILSVIHILCTNQPWNAMHTPLQEEANLTNVRWYSSVWKSELSQTYTCVPIPFNKVFDYAIRKHQAWGQIELVWYIFMEKR